MYKDKGMGLSLHYKFNGQIYDPESIQGKFRMKKFLRILSEYLNMKKGKVLDVGCGMGVSTFALEKLGFKPTGVDISKTYIQRAQNIAEKKKLLSKFFLKSAVEIETLKEAYDAVTFLGNALPHFSIEELDEVIRKAWNVLNIDGIILFHYADWVNILFASYQKTLVEKNLENKVMLSYHSVIDTTTGSFERLFLLPESGELFRARFHIWSPWIIEFLLKRNRFKRIESHNIENNTWITKAIR
ncbi:MAG: hypothetical protein B5M53_11860 [Candidatus Cloacimonas sp. 4484_209]|nr:MAG: hypothetical protein B5M53_11860 [Candidatus Cloacimonas sp. 4484_209]